VYWEALLDYFTDSLSHHELTDEALCSDLRKLDTPEAA